jgi:hypothetical protein
MPVAHYQPPPRLIELFGQRIDIRVGLGAQGRGQHPSSSLTGDLVQTRHDLLTALSDVIE